MSGYGRVAVLMGGWSEERPISLISGECAYQALRERGVEASAVDVQRDTLALLRDQGFDRCFLALHGIGGEDGEVQQVLEAMELPYSGSGQEASRICMDKMETKKLWWEAHLPTPRGVVLEPGEAEDPWQELGLPLVIKPVDQGSSIGVIFVHQAEEVQPAVAAAREHGSRILLERLVRGTEYTVGILQGEALPMIRLRPDGEFFDYQAKYESEETGYDIPCGLPPAMESELMALALRAFECTGAEGYGRVDLILDDLDRVWLLEVNTAPGLRHHSLLPMAAEAAGLDYGDLMLRMLDTSCLRQPAGELAHG